MTHQAAEFAADHGDATTWTAADIETEQNLAAIDHLDQPAPARDQHTTAA